MRITERKLRQIIKKEIIEDNLVNELFGFGKPKKADKLNAKDATEHAELLKTIIYSLGAVLRTGDKEHPYFQKLQSDLEAFRGNTTAITKLFDAIKLLDQDMNSDKYVTDPSSEF